MGLSYGAPCVGCGKELGRAKRKGRSLCKHCRPLVDEVNAEAKAASAFPGFIIPSEVAANVGTGEQDLARRGRLKRVFGWLWRS